MNPAGDDFKHGEEIEDDKDHGGSCNAEFDSLGRFEHSESILGCFHKDGSEEEGSALCNEETIRDFMRPRRSMTRAAVAVPMTPKVLTSLASQADWYEVNPARPKRVPAQVAMARISVDCWIN